MNTERRVEKRERERKTQLAARLSALVYDANKIGDDNRLSCASID